jgi:hypothetical protein
VKKYLGETKEPITYINKGTLESKDIDNLYSILVKRPLTQK